MPFILNILKRKKDFEIPTKESHVIFEVKKLFFKKRDILKIKKRDFLGCS